MTDDRYDELGPLAFAPDDTIEIEQPPVDVPRDTCGLRPGSRRVASSSGDRDYRYIGVVRLDGRPIAECGHEHRNRDWNGATDCARAVLAGAANPNVAAAAAGTICDRWMPLTHATGHTYSKTTIDAAKTAAHTDAATYRAAVDTVRTAIAR